MEKIFFSKTLFHFNYIFQLNFRIQDIKLSQASVAAPARNDNK